VATRTSVYRLYKAVDGDNGNTAVKAYFGSNWDAVEAALNNIVNVKAPLYGAVGDSDGAGGGTDDTTAIAAAYAAATASKGICYFPPGRYRTTGSLTPGANTILRGAGKGATTIDYRGTGYWFDLNASTGSNDTSLEDLTITVASGGVGAIRIGRTSDNYDANAARERFVLRNLNITGPGATNAGTIGMSLTQFSDSRVDHVTVSGFETGVIFDRTTVNSVTRLRVNSMRYGLNHSAAAGSGSAATGNLNDVFELCDIGGVVTGADAYLLKCDASGAVFLGCYFEANGIPAGVTMTAMAWFSARGRLVRMIGCNFDYTAGTGTLTNTMLFTAGAAKNLFLGCTAGSTGMPVISMGNPSGPGGNEMNQFVGCSEWLADDLLATAITAGYAAVIGPTRTTANGTRLSGTTWADKIRMKSGRMMAAQGADVASANNLTLGADGNVFRITGVTQINLIDNRNWQAGAVVTLLFAGALTVKHGIAVSTDYVTLILSGGVDFATAVGGTSSLTLVYNTATGFWHEIGRSA
jgi:hypothetical protein